MIIYYITYWSKLKAKLLRAEITLKAKLLSLERVES